jgi:CubicO group peptidase (beta-lactamase class C family)
MRYASHLQKPGGGREGELFAGLDGTEEHYHLRRKYSPPRSMSRRWFLQQTTAAGALVTAAWLADPIGRSIARGQGMISSQGSDANGKGVVVPDTPAGHRLAQWLSAIGSGAIETIRTFHTEFGPADGPPNFPAFATAMDLLFRSRHGAPELHGIVSSSDHTIVAHLYTGLSELWHEARLEVEPDPPHRLAGLGLRPASPPAGRTPATDDDVARELERYLAKLSDVDVFSGAVLVAKDGQPFFVRAYGLAHREAGTPNRVDTRFNLGSMNKMFTAVSVAQLAQQGKLSFDEPIAKFLPDYPRDVAEKVTVHHLLTHTSGLGDFFGPEFFAEAKDRVRAPRDYFPLFADRPLEFEPGTDWRYSNAGFIVLGAIIEAVSSRDYFDYVREHVYTPAGMTGSDSFERDAAVPNLAIGYMDPLPLDPRDLVPEMVLGPREENTRTLPRQGSPAGGGYATVEDLLCFDLALRTHRLLDPQHTDLVLAGKVDTAFGLDERYAYGFIDARVNGTRITGHGGGAPGINANLDMYLDRRYTVAVLANYDGAAELVNRKIRTLLT